MVNRSLTDEDWPCGHALMATVPPRQHCEDHGMDVQYPHKLPDLPKPDLVRMLNLCAQLPGLNEELTPVMAWAFILSHPACPEMTKVDFDAIRDDLKPKVACYGYVVTPPPLIEISNSNSFSTDLAQFLKTLRLKTPFTRFLLPKPPRRLRAV